MFSVYGFEESILNAYRVAQPFVGEREAGTTTALRESYLDFLEEHQPYMPVNRAEDLVIVDEAVESRLVAAYSHNAALNDLRQSEIIGEPYRGEPKERKVAQARAALEEFRSLDDELTALFDLTIHSLVIRPSNTADGRASYGGSSSAAMGVIWLSLGDTVTQRDIVEMLLHELTHHLLFLDEHNYPHYDYDLIVREENRAYSAILNLHRPMDKVVHSIVVATELILGRRSFLPADGECVVHPSTEKLTRETLAAYESVMALPNVGEVVRPRALEIIQRCQAVCRPAGVA
jgi:hypothetical protein